MGLIDSIKNIFGSKNLYDSKDTIKASVKTSDDKLKEIFRFKMPDLSMSILKVKMCAKRIGGSGNIGDHVIFEQGYMARNFPNNIYFGQCSSGYFLQQMPTYGIQAINEGSEAICKVQGAVGEEMIWNCEVEIETYKF